MLYHSLKNIQFEFHTYCSETLQMDQEEANFSYNEVNSKKQMELFGNPAHQGCNGTRALPGCPGPCGEAWPP